MLCFSHRMPAPCNENAASRAHSLKTAHQKNEGWVGSVCRETPARIALPVVSFWNLPCAGDRLSLVVTVRYEG